MYIFNFLPPPNFKFDTSISSKVQNQTFCRISISLVAKVTQIRKSFKLKNYLVESGLGGNVWVASGPSNGDDDDEDVWLVSGPPDGGVQLGGERNEGIGILFTLHCCLDMGIYIIISLFPENKNTKVNAPKTVAE